MANIIQVKRSSVPAKVPVVGDLSLGEFAINTYDGKLYIKKDSGTASIVEIGAASSVVLAFPFYNSSSVLDSIALLSNYVFPFFKANGSASNISTTT